jgi:putative ABC transport system permease protein
LGLQPDQVLAGQMTLPSASYSTIEKRTTFYAKVLTTVRALPGVDSVALCSALGPYNAPSSPLTIKGQAPIDSLEAIHQVEISDDYFSVLGMRWLRGRRFDSRDRASSQLVAIVNEPFARKYLPKQDPLGAQIKLGNPGDDAPWLTVVGVVDSEERTTVYQEMGYVEPALVYVPVDQTSDTSMGLVVRAVHNSLSLGPLLQREVSMLDWNVPVYDIKTMSQRYSEFLAYPQFRAALMGVLAGLTLLLAAIGFYGVLTHMVVQRTQEIGVRMALGAQRREVLSMVVLGGTKLAIIGVSCGAVGGLLLARAMTSLLYGVGVNDATIFCCSAALLICVALLATYIPARVQRSSIPWCHCDTNNRYKYLSMILMQPSWTMPRKVSM